MLTKTPLKQLVEESAQIHSTLLCSKRSDIIRNIVAVEHAIKARYEYKRR